MTTTPSYLSGLSGGTITNVTLRNAKFSAEISAAIQNGTMSLSKSQVSQLEFTISDPHMAILKAGLFALETPMAFASQPLMVAAIEVDEDDTGPIVTVTARALGAQKMRQDFGALVSSNVSATEFMEPLARKAGLKFVGQPSAKKASVSRVTQTGATAQRESSWDTGQRLAEELGYIAYESEGTYYFGKPTWLLTQLKKVPVTWNPGDRNKNPEWLLKMPNCRVSMDSEDKAKEANLEISPVAQAPFFTPGCAMPLKGIPGFEVTYSVDEVTIPLGYDQRIAVSTSQPVDPFPQRAA